jgi:hypothetical protein
LDGSAPEVLFFSRWGLIFRSGVGFNFLVVAGWPSSFPDADLSDQVELPLRFRGPDFHGALLLWNAYSISAVALLVLKHRKVLLSIDSVASSITVDNVH